MCPQPPGAANQRTDPLIDSCADAHTPSTQDISDDPSRLTVLVTGANGLVGRALCEDLDSRGHQVLAALRDPQSHVATGRVRPVQAPDLTDPSALWPLSGVDVVVHAAARVHIMNPQADEANRFMAINRDGTERLARQCAAHRVKRLVFLSTIKVNGESTPPGKSFTASDPPNPIDPYSVSKLQAETALQAVASDTELEVTVIRPPLVYGPGAKGNLGMLERALRQGVPLPIGALDSNRRSLVSLANLVDLIACCVVHPKAANAVFLVSDDEDVSTLTLAQAMAKACRVQIRTVKIPRWLLRLAARLFGKGEMLRRLTENLQIDVCATRARLNWTPVQTVEQAMASAFGQGADDHSDAR